MPVLNIKLWRKETSLFTQNYNYVQMAWVKGVFEWCNEEVSLLLQYVPDIEAYYIAAETIVKTNNDNRCLC